MAFLRHGAYQQRPNTPSALQPWALTDAGCAQARTGAHTLKQWALEQGFLLDPAISCSGALRAWQTADVLATTLNQCQAPFHCPDPSQPAVFHPVIEPHLHERSVGAAANLTLDEIETALADDPRYASPPQDWKSDSHYCLPFEGAESLIDAGARVKTQLERLCQQSHTRYQPNTASSTAFGPTQNTTTTPVSTLKVVIGHGASFRHAAYLMGLLPMDQIQRLSLFHGEPLLFRYQPAISATAPQITPTWTQLSGQWKSRTPVHAQGQAPD